MALVIDAYNHIWRANPRAPEHFLHLDKTPEMLIEQMDRGGVDRAVVCSLGQAIDNAYIAEAVRRYPDRLIGFAEANPRDPQAISSIRRAVEDLGLRGLKLHPLLMAHPVMSMPLMGPIFEVCQELDIPIYGHCMSDIWNMPLHYEEMLKHFPRVKLILGHLGLFWAEDEAFLVAKRNANVWLETSAVPLGDIRGAIEAAGADKVVMGTDWPVMDFDLQREMIRRATRDDQERALVEGGNLARVLGLA
jgi:predicted TIM-barrel fold metal-dependent hydrolase